MMHWNLSSTNGFRVTSQLMRTIPIVAYSVTTPVWQVPKSFPLIKHLVTARTSTDISIRHLTDSTLAAELIMVVWELTDHMCLSSLELIHLTTKIRSLDYRLITNLSYQHSSRLRAEL